MQRKFNVEGERRRISGCRGWQWILIESRRRRRGQGGCEERCFIVPLVSRQVGLWIETIALPLV